MGKKRGAGAEAAFESGVDDTEADALGLRTRAWKAKHPSRDYVGMPLRRFHLQQSGWRLPVIASGAGLHQEDSDTTAPSAGGRGAAEAGS